MHVIHVNVSIVQTELTYNVNISGGFTDVGEEMRSYDGSPRGLNKTV